MIGEMLDEVRALFRLPNLFLALYDPGTDLIGFPYFVDESDPHPEPRPPGRTSTDWILRNRRPLHVGPDEFHALVAAGEMDLVGTPAQAWLGVPLSGHGAAIGALVAQDYHTLDAFGAGTERLMAVAAHHISAALAHERAERRLARLSECLVRFGPDPDANIGLLTGVAGELLGAQCGLYARMRGEKLVVASRWNVPDDLAAAPGRLCADTVAVDRQEALVVRDLPSTAYAQTDPVVAQSGLRTYIGQSVTKGDAPLGVLCALFRGDLEFDSSDRDVLNIIASAIAVEEERRRSADALRHLNATLEHRVTARTGELATALEELHEFCRAVSHDLRAPLRHVDGYARILLEDHGANLDQHGEACIARIREASMNMARLIDGLLALSRVTRSELDPGRRDAGPVAVEILSQLGARDPGRNVETIVERELIVWADAALLRAALECLLNNAWKFTAHAEKAVIEVGATDTSKGRALFVRDNGAGFQMAYARRLFHPFERLHDASDFSGTGMGLAVVHRAVRRHGGEAWAEGEPGRGATFYVRFPEPPDSG
jgi:K+-sensing histidine kinase KdpD